MSYTEDFYAEKAKKLGLRARSFFKLEEIDQKFQLIRPRQRILDLGAAPGSWSQYCLKKTAGNVQLFCVDLQTIKPLTEGKATLIIGSVYELETLELPETFDLILSDMAPSTTGSRETDAAQSFELTLASAKIALSRLAKNGFLVSKYLQGSDFNDLQKFFKDNFQSFKLFKPKSSRKISAEIFFVAKK